VFRYLKRYKNPGFGNEISHPHPTILETSWKFSEIPEISWKFSEIPEISWKYPGNLAEAQK
jgi:hypothetical protein